MVDALTMPCTTQNNAMITVWVVLTHLNLTFKMYHAHVHKSYAMSEGNVLKFPTETQRLRLCCILEAASAEALT